MKKVHKLFSSNKGNATYYVMAVIMVITIMVSGLLAVSLRSSVVSTNYTSDIESYNKCESVLQKIKGELSVALVGELIKDPDAGIKAADIDGWFKAFGSKAQEVIATYGITPAEYYYPIRSDGDTSYKADNYLSEEELVLLQSFEFVADRCYGFKIVESDAKDYVSIKDVFVKDGSVGIQTDIKLVLDNDCKVTDVVFENYKILTVTEDAEGGGS